MSYEERSCRLCGGPLETLLDLGELSLSTFVAAEKFLSPRVPLDFCACVNCTLVQLRHTTTPDLMFRKYWYLSSINETMRDELADIVQKAQDLVELQQGDVVVDVGANDGTLLAAYPTDRSLFKVGYEPALNLQEKLKGQASIVVADYFPRAVQDSVADLFERQVKIFTSIAMFYDLDEPRLFVEAVARALHKDGVWIVQFQDLDQMCRATAFDNICHEHLIYYSLDTFEQLIQPFGLKVVHAERRKINGGSYRLYVRRSQHDASATVEALRHIEEGCQDWNAFYQFTWRAGEVRKQLQGLIEHLLATGKTIDVYGASTKFNTLAQWCGITGENVRQAWERSPDKFGLKTVTGIPIVDEVQGRLDPPDALLVGIWQFRESIMYREQAFLRQPFRAFLFPLPNVEIVTGATRVE